MARSTRVSLNSTSRTIRAWFMRAGDIGSVSCRRVTTRATTGPPLPPQRRLNGCYQSHRRCWRISRRPNTISMARSHERRHVALPRPTSDARTLTPSSPITGKLRFGQRTAPRVSQTAQRWSAPKSRAWKAGNWTRCGFTKRPFDSRASTASFRMKVSPTNSPRASMPRAT